MSKDPENSRPDSLRSIRSFLASTRRASQFDNATPRPRSIFLPNDEDHIGSKYLRVPGDERNPQDQSEPGPLRRQISSNEPASETTPLNPSTKQNGTGPEFPELYSQLSEPSLARVTGIQRKRDGYRSDSQDSSSSSASSEPTLIKFRRDDGTGAEVMVGQSTLPHTIFNSSNVLVGVGLLTLPLALAYTGWVLGISGLIASCLVTKYTAGLLAKCLDVDSSLANYGDVAYVAFGENGRIATSCFITLELLLTCVGQIVLFADTLRFMVDGMSATWWKIIVGIILTPIDFFPMRWLGFTSICGLLCGLAIILSMIVMGSLKADAPGSLQEVATTYAFPPNWKTLPLSFGLIMSLWSGHSVFPNIYRDMEKPAAYGKGLNYTFGFMWLSDILIGVVGYLLYGNHVLDEVTTNIITNKGYSFGARVFVAALVAIIPLTKFSLRCAPIVSTLKIAAGIDPRTAMVKPTRFNQSRSLTRLLRIFFRIAVTAIAVLIAIAVPNFELVAGVIGGFFGFLSAVTFPLAFHLRMFSDRVSGMHLMMDLFLIVLSVVMGISGTVWEFLPGAWLERG